MSKPFLRVVQHDDRERLRFDPRIWPEAERPTIRAWLLGLWWACLVAIVAASVWVFGHALGLAI